MKKAIIIILTVAVLVTSCVALFGCNKTDDQLIVATNAAFPPFEYMEGNKYYGVDMEIAAALAKKLNKKLVIKNMEFDAVIPSVENGYSNIGMAGLTVNEKRKEVVTFSDTYYDASQMLIVKASDTTFDACETAADVEAILNAKTTATKIGVQKGTTGQLYVEGDEEWEFDGFPVTCVPITNGSLAVQGMINGTVDYVVIDEGPAKAIVKSFTEGQVKIINIRLTEEEYAFAVGKSDTAFLAQVNAFLAEIKASGEFQEIVDKYFSGGTPTAVVSND